MTRTLKDADSLPGRLTSDALRLWAGRGNGKPCEWCRKTISAEDVQYELEVTGNPGVAVNASRGDILSFHLQCYDRWRASLDHFG